MAPRASRLQAAFGAGLTSLRSSPTGLYSKGPHTVINLVSNVRTGPGINIDIEIQGTRIDTGVQDIVEELTPQPHKPISCIAL